ncbi:hypothetical protein LTR53_001524 [Teratosphaeriaceae sp. CCFEE 6253]|nr:hypothetical protein LTR53_001524 [Teratosphaeriaceae sp. CCFEE 6253]
MTDWPDSVTMENIERALIQEHMDEEEDDEEEDDEDFYDEDDDAKAGAVDGESDADASDLLSSLMPAEDERPVVKLPQVQTQPPQREPDMSAEQKRAENQRKAELLRAQLMAKRQNTPMKVAAPAKLSPVVVQLPPKPATPVPSESKKTASDVFQFGSESRAIEDQSTGVNGDSISLETMIDDAKRAAEAKKSQQAATVQNNEHTDSKAPAPINAVKPITPAPPVEPSKAPAQQQRAPVQVHQASTMMTNTPAAKVQTPTELTSSYYSDLAAWLEFTGYHDVAYRSSKLQKHKARKVLEAEAAKIQEQLDRLLREEEAEMLALRTSTAHSMPAPQTAPELPSTMPVTDDAALLVQVGKGIMTNGTKRPHSPAPLERNSRRRDEQPAANGFRIRGANISPSSPVPRDGDLERRISYPEPRRRSDATLTHTPLQSRDPSLERRQSYYRRDGERGGMGAAPRALDYDGYGSRDHSRDGRPLPSEYRPAGRGSGAAYRGRGAHQGRNYSESYRGGGQTQAGGRRDLLH